MSETKVILTSGEVAKLLRVHINTVRSMAESGQLPAIKVGTRYRFHKDAVLEVIKKGGISE